MKHKVTPAFFLAGAVSTVVTAGALPKSPLFDSLSNYVSGGRGDVFGSIVLSRPASDRVTVRIRLDRGAPNHFYSIEIFEAVESCAGTNCNRPFDDFAAVSKSFTTDASASELYQKAIGAGSAVESVSFQNHSDQQVAEKIIQFIHEALERRRP